VVSMLTLKTEKKITNFPSSHSSPGSTIPSPQKWHFLHSAVQLAPGDPLTLGKHKLVVHLLSEIKRLGGGRHKLNLEN